MADSSTPIAGRNGVVVVKPSSRSRDGEKGFRTYEVHQRERVGQSTEKIKPIQLISDEYRLDPYPALAILRENYPCYRDWLGNSYWLTRYDDVSSVFSDDANFETRPKAWYYDREDFGRDLGGELSVLTADAEGTDAYATSVAEMLADGMRNNGEGDLARDFAARFPLELLARLLDLPEAARENFFAAYWRAQRGVSWMPELQQDGHRALAELVDMFTPLVEARRQAPGDDMISAMVQLEVDGGPVTATDVARTMLERDHETLHGSLANLWYLLLTHPLEFEKARAERRLMKLAYLETMRHSTPVLCVHRFARQEVERFGRLLPEGARVVCSAAAANRDPRIFNDPDAFVVGRRDMCHREPRGQYRADGLASGIAFGLGKPSVHPAVPEDRPRSRYAINRDTVVDASTVLLEKLGDIALAPGAEPILTALTVGEMHTCWQLPVRM